MARVSAILFSTVMLLRFTNPSVIYHWIRGQGTFKLYLLKAVFEISDLLLKGASLGIIENFSRDFQLNSMFRKITATISLMFGTLLHSMVLTMEMFIVHVSLTSSADACFSYVFYNCFGEIKISVFKKCDFGALN